MKKKLYTHILMKYLYRDAGRGNLLLGSLDLECRSRSTRWRTSFDIRRSPTDSALLCWRSAEVHPAGTRRHQTPRMATDLELAHTVGGERQYATPDPYGAALLSLPLVPDFRLRIKLLDISGKGYSNRFIWHDKIICYNINPENMLIGATDLVTVGFP